MEQHVWSVRNRTLRWEYSFIVKAVCVLFNEPHQGILGDTNWPGAVHDAVQAVGNGEDSTVWKLFADGVLNEVVCLQVHSCCRCVSSSAAPAPDTAAASVQHWKKSHTGGQNLYFPKNIRHTRNLTWRLVHNSRQYTNGGQQCSEADKTTKCKSNKIK